MSYRIVKTVILRPDLAVDQKGHSVAPRSTGPKVLALGDWVELWAKPTACWIDTATAGTRIATHLCGCSGCSKRRRFLNIVIPDVKVWRGGWQGAWQRVAVAWQRVYRPHAGAVPPPPPPPPRKR